MKASKPFQKPVPAQRRSVRARPGPPPKPMPGTVRSAARTAGGGRSGQKQAMPAPAETPRPGRPALSDPPAPVHSRTASELPRERQWGWLVLFVAGLALIVVSALVAITRVLSGPELAVFQFINGWPDALRPFFL